MSRPLRILSIDGGGIRGLVPALVLDHLERAAGAPIHTLFDLIAGTSTGGVLACGLAAGLPAGRMADLYLRHGGRIFEPRVWRRVGAVVAAAKHDHRVLEGALAEALGDATLADAKTHLLVPAYDLQNRRPHFFKSWRAQGIDAAPGEARAESDFALRDVARATAAAPTYFEPALVRNRAGRSFSLVDGAVYANNPALCALAESRRLWPTASRAVLLSVGTGLSETPIDHAQACGWGVLGWARPVLDVMMDGMAEAVDYQIRAAFPETRYFRLNVPLGGPREASGALDDASPANLAKLCRLGRDLAATSSGELAAALALLV